MATPSPPLGTPSTSNTPSASTHVLHNNSPNTTWYFPGPSSRYHHRERSLSYQNPCPKSTYTPHGPVLSTEKRASHHRRAASSVNVFSPPSSESGRSPLGRFHSYTPKSSTPTANMNGRIPTTPARSPEARRSTSLQDSPFSDYFTDDERGREYGRTSYSAPKSETRQIVMRMQKLQAQLMREDKGNDILNVVWKKMSEMEDEVQVLESRSGNSVDMRDSGLFMDEDQAPEKPLEGQTSTEDDKGYVDDIIEQSVQSQDSGQGLLSVEHEKKNQEVALVEKRAEHDFAMLEAQRVLANVTKAQQQLRQRYAEFRELNYESTVEIEEKEQELEGLRAENERLRSDIGFDHSELLFLKLQFKALEVEVSDLEGSKRISEMKRSRILKEMKSWRTDWQAVERKFKRRLSRYGVLSPEDNRDLRSDSPTQQFGYDEEDDWHLESVKKDIQGKVQSITIRRLPSSGQLNAEQLKESVYLSQPICQPGEEMQGRSLNSSQALQTPPPPQPAPVPRRQTKEQSTQTSIASQAIQSPPQQQEIAESLSKSDSSHHHAQPTKPSQPEKSAWQDLWAGLSNLAGFTEDDDDDDDNEEVESL